jgi:hypothetical protein
MYTYIPHRSQTSFFASLTIRTNDILESYARRTWKEEKKKGRKEGRKEGRKDGRKEGRRKMQEGRKMKAGGQKGTKDGRCRNKGRQIKAGRQRGNRTNKHTGRKGQRRWKGQRPLQQTIHHNNSGFYLDQVTKPGRISHV